MGDTAIKILLVEDNPGDVRLIQEFLAEAKRSRFDLKCADTLSQGLKQLEQGDIDIVLLDLSLPDSQGLETFATLQRQVPNVSVVVLTGMDDEELAVNAVREGAQDYLVKGQVEGNLLERAIKYAIERKRVRNEIQALNANLERLVAERTKELSAAYEELAKANQELRELDRMKSAFITVITHELRTPLNIISGMLAIVEKKTSGKQDAMYPILQAAIRATNRLQRLIVRALEFTYEGKYERRLRRVGIKVDELIQHVTTEVSPFIEIRKQKLLVDIPEHLPSVSIDYDKIHDVLINLLMNAIKFTPDAGTIEISAHLRDKETMEFSVSDTGIGIADEDKPHVFDAFFSTFDVDHYSSGEHEFEKRGMGLGLAIVKKFVEMHGGKVGLESTPGKGSRFYFIIPLKS